MKIKNLSKLLLLSALGFALCAELSADVPPLTVSGNKVLSGGEIMPMRYVG